MARLRLLTTLVIIAGSYCIASALADIWHGQETYSRNSCQRVEYPQNRSLGRLAQQRKLCDGVKPCSAVRL